MTVLSAVGLGLLVVAVYIGLVLAPRLTAAVLTVVALVALGVV